MKKGSGSSGGSSSGSGAPAPAPAPASQGKARRGEGVAESKPSTNKAPTPTPAPDPTPAAAPAAGKGRQTHLTLSPGLVDWLAAGILLREAGKAEGLDRLIGDVGREHFGQVRWGGGDGGVVGLVCGDRWPLLLLCLAVFESMAVTMPPQPYVQRPPSIHQSIN